MESIARVNPKYFAAINLFSADRDVRYYLNGVFIEPHPEKGVIIVATDGHRLGLIHDPSGFTDRPIIVGNISKALASACAAKGSRKAGNEPTTLYICANAPYGDGGAIVQSGNTCTGDVDPFSAFTTHMSKIEIIDAKYPDYRRILPSKEDRSERFPCLNAGYLATFSQAANILTKDKYGRALELIPSGTTTSVVVRINCGDITDRFVGLVMPMRSDAPSSILPAWLMPKEEPKAEPAPAPQAKPRYRWTPDGFKPVEA